MDSHAPVKRLISTISVHSEELEDDDICSSKYVRKNPLVIHFEKSLDRRSAVLKRGKIPSCIHPFLYEQNSEAKCSVTLQPTHEQENIGP